MTSFITGIETAADAPLAAAVAWRRSNRSPSRSGPPPLRRERGCGRITRTLGRTAPGSKRRVGRSPSPSFREPRLRRPPLQPRARHPLRRRSSCCPPSCRRCPRCCHCRSHRNRSGPPPVRARPRRARRAPPPRRLRLRPRDPLPRARAQVRARARARGPADRREQAPAPALVKRARQGLPSRALRMRRRIQSRCLSAPSA